MIGYLRGRLRLRAPQLAVVDVQGVGYEVHIPLSTYYQLEKLGADAEVALHIHTHVRDDALQLYGFESGHEKRLFELLISVSGIGPRLAQTALSGMAPDELAAALAAGDVARLTTIPGLGKKTAERMVLELQDKVGRIDAVAGVEAPAADVNEDLLQALLGLGYRRAEAERASAKVLQEHSGAAFPELLREVLKRLSRL